MTFLHNYTGSATSINLGNLALEGNLVNVEH